MKILIKSTVFAFFLFLVCCNKINAQATEDEAGTYMLKNVAVTNFKLLGVSNKQYAKCVSTVNYLEEDKKLKVVSIGRVDFADDGQGYDLVSNDGILTSKLLFDYATEMQIIPIGTYYNSASNNSFVCDDTFEHIGRLTSAAKIKISCKLRWVHCNNMPNPGAVWLCNWAGWPYGEFVLSDCTISWE